MGFFKKKKKDKDKDAEVGGDKSPDEAADEASSAPQRAETSALFEDDAAPKAMDGGGARGDDPLGLGKAASRARTSGESRSKVQQRKAVDPDEGHRVALRAASFLTGIARETRGLFEAVRPMAEVKAVWSFFTTEDIGSACKAAEDGSLNPHAAASLIVYHLRDAAEPLSTKALRTNILAAAQLPDASERLANLRSLCSSLPDNNRKVFSSIGIMVAAVAAEHDTCYKDGISTRMSALAQLFGPLFLRPGAKKFDTEMAASVQFAEDIFSNPSLLSAPISMTHNLLSPISANSSAMSEDLDNGAGVQLPQKRACSSKAAPVPALKGLPQGSIAPIVPSLKGLPTGGGGLTSRDAASTSMGNATSRGDAPPSFMINTSKAVTFRAALKEKGGGDYPPDRKPPPSPGVQSPTAATSRADKATATAQKHNRPNSAPAHRAFGGQGLAAAAAAAPNAAPVADESDDETNYNLPATSDQWVEEVKALSDDERKTHLQAAMKGGAMLKYSSRGRPTALMFFRLSPDTDMLNWAPVTSPENLKYGLVMDQVVRILPGPLAGDKANILHIYICIYMYQNH